MKQPLVLQDAYKRFTEDQDKVLPPGQTVKEFRSKLGKLDLDILKETRRIDTGRLGIPVFFSRCGKDAMAVTGTKKQMGKGATPEQSEASAVMELAERFSFFSFCGDPSNFITASFGELTSSALDFESIAKAVHDTSDDLSVTRRIFENLPMRWAWAYSLTRETNIMIPFDWFFMINEFNGPCAGNCVEEALSQGICEIVERHVSAVVSHGRLKTPAIDPDSATDPAVVEMTRKYRSAGITFHLSDMTLGMGIPTVGMLAYDTETFPEKSEIVWTAGTTPDPQKALSRAMTEVAQLAGDFNTNANYVASGLPKFNRLDQAEYVTRPDATVRISDLPDLSSDNIRVEVENLVAALAQRDMEVLVLDTRHRGLDIPAFYTVVPGAHFRERALGTSVGMFSAKLMAEKLKPEVAAARLEEMNRQLPGKYYVQFYLGSVHLAMNDPKKALAHLERALESAPLRQDIPSIYSYMGVCLKEMGKYREALSVIDKGVALDDQRTDLYNLMGFCHFKLKAYEKAIAAFEKNIRLDPSSAIDYANIGSNYREMGEIKKAVEYYELALALDPTIDFALENLLRLQGKSNPDEPGRHRK